MAIFFIWHGQSKFNAAFEGSFDPMIFDAPLTPLGFSQAAEAGVRVSDLGITRVITSPLTRAIQTAKATFVGLAPIEVNHGHHELLQYSGDVGRPLMALKQDFPDLSFDHFPDQWWHAQDNAEGEMSKEPLPVFQCRIAQFVAALDNFGPERVAIVGHGNAFQETIGYILNNCEVYQYR
ncbi:histidine phosphatase family protein [Sulfitobacter sp.]|uniref:histidine phosphatase family protein n=1 Tax=Sulfitobacter sp. TaxID=1903071 RepID=UPI0030019183